VEILYYTLVGGGLYFISDWILQRIEAYRGARLQNRSLIFFVIILVLAMGSFQVMQGLMKMYASEPPPVMPPIPTEPPQGR